LTGPTAREPVLERRAEVGARDDFEGAEFLSVQIGLYFDPKA